MINTIKLNTGKHTFKVLITDSFIRKPFLIKSTRKLQWEYLY